jgi:hypothetical protein
MSGWYYLSVGQRGQHLTRKVVMNIYGGYINVGVYGLKTKTALKGAIKNAPENVQFYGTANGFCGTVHDVPEGTTLCVVGPDPYNDRRWYANVKRTAKGWAVS